MKENNSGSLGYKHFKDEKKAKCYYKNEASKVREINPQSKNHEVASERAVSKITHEKTILEY